MSRDRALRGAWLGQGDAARPSGVLAQSRLHAAVSKGRKARIVLVDDAREDVSICSVLVNVAAYFQIRVRNAYEIRSSNEDVRRRGVRECVLTTVRVGHRADAPVGVV